MKDGFFLVGAALVIAGLWQFHPGAGLIFAGGFLLLLCFSMPENESNKHKRGTNQ